MPAIGASGILGIATEVTSGTYVAPEHFVPFENESLQYQQDTQWRRPIRNTPGVVGAVAGDVHTEGEIAMEALTDSVIRFLLASRCTVVKTGASAPFTYTFTPAANAVPTKTLSIAIRRNNEVFGYTGCVVGSFTFSIENGMLKFSVNILGRDEATAAALTPVWDTQTPYGAGQYNLQVPTATQIFDADTFEFTSEDNAEAQFRLKNTGRGAQFISFGESSAELSLERDFETRADYDAFKALTAQSITMAATKGANESIAIELPAAIKDSYEVSLGGQGDLVRASISYQGVIDSTGKHYEIVIVSESDIDVA
jgi:hypothetical protein